MFNLGDKDKNDMLVNEPMLVALGYETACREAAAGIRALPEPEDGK